MIKSNGYFWVMGLAAISALTAYPCQAQTAVELNINLTGNKNITTTNQQNGTHTSTAARSKTINTSKSFVVSETNTVPVQPSATAAPENRAVRSNPLGCRFFNTPSMQQ